MVIRARGTGIDVPVWVEREVSSMTILHQFLSCFKVWKEEVVSSMEKVLPSNTKLLHRLQLNYKPVTETYCWQILS